MEGKKVLKLTGKGGHLGGREKPGAIESLRNLLE